MINTHNIKQSIRLGAIGFGLFLAAQMFFSPVQVNAATPPDACFDFDTGTGTIVSYHEYEDGDNSNPACPKNVDIPSTIASTPVTAIGDSAFASKDLVAVTIPSSVLSIGNSAFAYNDIANNLVIPNSVTTIGVGAFRENQITP